MDLDDYNPFVDEAAELAGSLLGESERAAVILAASSIDVGLEKLLQHVLHPCAGGEDSLFDSDRALGTFSAKILIAHRLGLINGDFERAIQLLRRIRNDFAHQLGNETLASGRQQGRLQELRRLFRNSTMYKVMMKKLPAGAEKHYGAKIYIVLCTVCILAQLHIGLTSQKRVDVGRPLSLDP